MNGRSATPNIKKPPQTNNKPNPQPNFREIQKDNYNNYKNIPETSKSKGSPELEYKIILDTLVSNLLDEEIQKKYRYDPIRVLKEYLVPKIQKMDEKLWDLKDSYGILKKINEDQAKKLEAMSNFSKNSSQQKEISDLKEQLAIRERQLKQKVHELLNAEEMCNSLRDELDASKSVSLLIEENKKLKEQLKSYNLVETPRHSPNHYEFPSDNKSKPESNSNNLKASEDIEELLELQKKSLKGSLFKDLNDSISNVLQEFKRHAAIDEFERFIKVSMTVESIELLRNNEIQLMVKIQNRSEKDISSFNVFVDVDKANKARDSVGLLRPTEFVEKTFNFKMDEKKRSNIQVHMKRLDRDFGNKCTVFFYGLN